MVPSASELRHLCLDDAEAAVEAVADAYLTLMQEATSRQSSALAIKSLSLAAGIGKITAAADVYHGDTVSKDTTEQDSPDKSGITDNSVLPPVRVLESVVMSMAFHPVRSIREEAHRTLKVKCHAKGSIYMTLDRVLVPATILKHSTVQELYPDDDISFPY